MMHMREFDVAADYPIMEGWCLGHGVDTPPAHILQTPGWIVETEAGKPLCCCFSYMANTLGLYWVAWITTCPGMEPTTVAIAIQYMLNGVELIMKNQGYIFAFTSTQSQGLVKLLTRMGWGVNHHSTQLMRTAS